ncbi:MAG: DUF4019 domain-containing protein [Desulfovibrio sp.]|nr:DUF4019 domain-containing protein [Desulfovibrio sp.]
MPKFIVIFLIALGLCVNSSTFAATAPDAAKEAADVWLALADKGDAQATWDQAASAFKSGIEQKEWESTLSKARQPLGEVTSRTLLSSEATTTLPGVADGEFVIFRYQTSFASKRRVSEALLMQKEADGMWRTVGYFLQ